MFVCPLYGQQYLKFHFDSNYTILERQDIRQRVNGRYKGFIFRELRGILHEEESDGHSALFRGTFFLYRQMTRNALHVSKVIDDVVPVSFRIDADGRMSVSEEYSMPPVRNFPVLPRDELNIGDTWREYGSRVVDPRGGYPTRIRFFSVYVYEGVETYVQDNQERSRHHISAQYALRYRAGQDPFGDPELKESQGKHLVDIYLPVDDDGIIFMKDTVEDFFYYMDGSVIQESGIILTWFDDIAGMDRSRINDSVANITSKEEYKDITVIEKPEGIMLQIKNINFYPDEDRILPGQSTKIEMIATILKEAGDHIFLVTGHTADIGTKESQLVLSEQRARVIVDLLSSMGIPQNRFIYRGRGGEDPIAPNDTEENRARNRRVEILILEGKP